MAAQVTRIVIFAKEPVPGRVKTRLIPVLGPEGAARLAGEMLDRAIKEARATGLAVELCGEPHAAAWFDGPVALTGQGEGDLGERLARAAERVLAQEPVLFVGADCPSLDSRRLIAAAEALATHDAVIHPAIDGGYVLLGLSRFDPSPFDGIAWSTESVCAETLGRLAALGWSVDVRETLADVDEPEDLALVAPR
ncbi:MAG TPA: TIGR04282 family arsenosugar biosynthesis glycosyltransferase [Allosphingosinicella sp.]|nr:TIGR04282 family arsenosugar biosynthesis glycosyltransferase [Allosphingosinicella sp.]